MLSTKSVGYSALFVLALGATLQPSVNATSFDGMYDRESISPSGCIDSNSCEYQCAASYTISTSGSTTSIYLTNYSSGCECDTITTVISGDTANGSYNSAAYSATRTSTGLTVVTGNSGLTCTSTYYYSTTQYSGAAQVGGYVDAVGWAIAATSAVMLSFF